MRNGLPLALLLAASCVSYTETGRHVKVAHAFDVSDDTLHADPFQGRCKLVRSEENGDVGRRMFDEIQASNYAATIGANSIYWLQDGADRIPGKLHDCRVAYNRNYGQFGLAATEIECKSDSGSLFRIPEYRATLKFYACAGASDPSPAR